MTYIVSAQSPLLNTSIQHTLSASDLITLSSAHKPQPFCNNIEGWGPLSRSRSDFTPCFLDLWVAVVAVWGILAGAGTLYYLRGKKGVVYAQRDWHLYLKLAFAGAFFIATTIQACFQAVSSPDVWLKDFQFWVNITILISTIVITWTQYLERRQISQPTGVVFGYWLLIWVIFAIKLRSLISRHAYVNQSLYFIAFCIDFGVATVALGLEWLLPNSRFTYKALSSDNQCPYERASIFDVVTFGWMTPMMKKGYRQYLTQHELWPLRDRDTASCVGRRLQSIWNNELAKKKPSLWRAMVRAFYAPYLRSVFMKTLSDILIFVQPQLLRLLIKFMVSYQTSNPQAPIKGIAIAVSMFLVSVLSTITVQQYFQAALETGMRIRSALTTVIYGKALKLSNDSRASRSTGDILNYMAVDTQRWQDLTMQGVQLWSVPLQIIFCMLSLYQLVGLSMFAGVGIMVLSIPVNAFLVKYLKTLQQVQMKNKDSRTRLMTEILANMKSIKMYAWTLIFSQKLSKVRNGQELDNLKKIGAISAVQSFTWQTVTAFVSTATFGVFVLISGRPLTTEIVFPALALFNMLAVPLAALPLLMTTVVEATVSVSRLSAFFQADELQSDAVMHLPTKIGKGLVSVSIHNGKFRWGSKVGSYQLSNINFTACNGELSCIVGRVGAGKSSFLQALVGDMWKEEGEVIVHGSLAYVTQSPWILNGSVMENITFGHAWDPNLYQKTLKACALTEDLKILTDGDQTVVGERGIALSGGQKARISLARAVYACTDVYLLDDVLSAVDQHVGRHIIENVLGPKGILATKTRILATNTIPVLLKADRITMLRDGRIVDSGSLDSIAAGNGEASHLVAKARSEGHNSVSEDGLATPNDKGAGLVQSTEIPNGEMKASGKDNVRDETNRTTSITLASGDESQIPTEAIVARVHEVGIKSVDVEAGTGPTKQAQEVGKQGKVKWSVYTEYVKASNIFATCFYLLMLVGAQSVQVGSGLWLKHWSEVNYERDGNPAVGKYVGVYFGIGMGAAVLAALQTITLWLFCSLTASRTIHDSMAKAIFHSPMSFFETNPMGRILNRFSSDVYRLDQSLAKTFNLLAINAVQTGWTLVLITASTPIFGPFIIPMGALYVYIQQYYIKSSRELKRLDSISKSPIFTHFQESLHGLTTIRAYQHNERFILENEKRVDANMQAYFPFISANRWLGVRLEFVGSIVIFFAALFAIIAVKSGSGPSAGMIGLAMSYALQITQNLNILVRVSGEAEMNSVSIERCLEYCKLPSEKPEILPDHRPNASWPAQGVVEFVDYSARYRSDLDLALKNINLRFKKHEKIGVVGRTGAGKSTLALSLFRIVEPASGHVVIDDMNIADIGLSDLRGRLAVIPQDAALFEGTVRDNLDPGHMHDDTELWSALDRARLKQHVVNMDGQLEATIQEGGSNLSQGQRQLVSFARALLSPSKILLLDEATAAIDSETDAVLQATLRDEALFQDRTIITIAHRIGTVLDSDRVVVLDHGSVVEFDTPAALIQRKGYFYELVREAGLLESSLPGVS